VHVGTFVLQEKDREALFDFVTPLSQAQRPLTNIPHNHKTSNALLGL
jgi:hypothetical protein